MLLSTFYAPICITAVCSVALLSVDLFFGIGRQHPSSEMYHHSTGTCVEVWCAPCLFFLHTLGGMSTFCEQIMGKQFFLVLLYFKFAVEYHMISKEGNLVN